MIATVEQFWGKYGGDVPAWPVCEHRAGGAHWSSLAGLCLLPAIWHAYPDLNTADSEPRCALHIGDLPGIFIEEEHLPRDR